MTTLPGWLRSWWWLVHKDLLREFHAPRIWPGMLLLGIVLGFIIEVQMDLPVEQQAASLGGLLWLAVVFAGTVALDRSFAGERQDGCWQSLLLYPVSPATIFAAKVTTNFLALASLDCVLVPAFAFFSRVPLLAQPGALVAILALANMGIAAAGTLVSALTNGMPQRGSLLVLLLLPLITPVVLGAAQATRILVTVSPNEELGRWMQLLGVFAMLFLTVGALIFEFVIEE